MVAARHQIFESQNSETEQHAEMLHVSHGAFKVGDALPLRMSVADMCRAFQISRSTFYRLLHEGKFDRFAIEDDIAGQGWSGELVAVHLRTIKQQRRSFGRKVRG